MQCSGLGALEHHPHHHHYHHRGRACVGDMEVGRGGMHGSPIATAAPTSWKTLVLRPKFWDFREKKDEKEVERERSKEIRIGNCFGEGWTKGDGSAHMQNEEEGRAKSRCWEEVGGIIR